MKIAFMPDLHLDHVANQSVIDDLLLQLVYTPHDAVVVLGDVSNAHTVNRHLVEIAQIVAPTPVYFVYGNHDFYGSSITQMRVGTGFPFQHNLRYLEHTQPACLFDHTYLIGVDGWAYTQDFDEYFAINDFERIQELRKVDTRARIAKNESERSAFQLQGKIRKSVEMGARHIVIATHVPFHPMMCLYDGKPTHESYLPYFCNSFMNQAIVFEAERNEGVQFSVFSGHTHHAFAGEMLGNVKMRVFPATYGDPQFHIVEIA